MKSESIIYLSLGSNLGDREKHLSNAKLELTNFVGEIIACSDAYENPPNGFEAELDFLNICLKIKTRLSPLNLLKTIKQIEQRLGRTIKNHIGYSSRCIDIDIILYKEVILQSKKLTIPHPHFRKRMFVLKPLNDIAYNEVDPETMLTITQLFNNCKDQSILRIYNP